MTTHDEKAEAGYKNMAISSAAAAKGIMALAQNPQVQQFARNAARGAIRQWGRSRQNRQRKGRWYAGKRIGIPPRFNTRPTAAPAALGQQMRAMPSANIRLVTGMEWVTDVSPMSGLTVNGVYTDSFPVNPMEEYTFPRLSTEASLYQQYELKQLQFYYVPACSSATAGTLAIGLQADPTAAIPTTLNEMMSLHAAQSGNMWQPMRISIPASALAGTLKKFYSKQSKDPHPDEDDRTQTVARLVLMTVGAATGVNYGNLRVQYTFEFSDPRPNPHGATTAQITRWAAPAADIIVGNADSNDGVASFFDADGATLMRKRTVHPTFIIFKFTHTVLGSGVNVTYDGVALTPKFALSDGTTGLQVYFVPQGKGLIEMAKVGDPVDLAMVTHSSNRATDVTL